MSKPRLHPKSRRSRQPARVCLLRVVRKGDGASMGFVAHTDPSGYIMSSNFAQNSATGTRAYWPTVRSSIPSGCFIMAAVVPRRVNVEVIDAEASTWRKVGARGQLYQPSARGRRELKVLEARRTAAHRAACYLRRANRSGLAWAHGCRPKLAARAAA